MLKCFNI